MSCPYCGADVTQASTFCKSCGAALQAGPSIQQMMDCPFDGSQEYRQSEADHLGYLPETRQTADFLPVTLPKYLPKNERRSQPSLALRLPLQLMSFALSVVLFVALLATVLLMDCNRVLSAAGIRQVMNAVFSVSQARVGTGLLPGAGGVGPRMDSGSPLPANSESTSDILNSGDTDALVDWICDMAGELTGQEILLDRQQVQSFVEQSTLSDYVAEKAAGYAADFINGTQDTRITIEELMYMLEENESLIENTFQLQITDAMKQEMEAVLKQTIEENGLNERIHQQVFASMEEALDAALPIEWDQLQSILQALTSDELLLCAIALCLLIALLLCVINFYNVPAGLTWTAVPCILVGCLLSLPVALLQSSPDILTQTLSVPALVLQLVLSFLSVFASIHYGVLTVGVLLLALSILWRILRATIRSDISYV